MQHNPDLIYTAFKFKTYLYLVILSFALNVFYNTFAAIFFLQPDDVVPTTNFMEVRSLSATEKSKVAETIHGVLLPLNFSWAESM